MASAKDIVVNELESKIKDSLESIVKMALTGSDDVKSVAIDELTRLKEFVEMIERQIYTEHSNLRER